MKQTETGKWSNEPPRAEGFYWYREPGEEPSVVEWCVDELGGVAFVCGDDRPRELSGEVEFWSEPLVPPSASLAGDSEAETIDPLMHCQKCGELRGLDHPCDFPPNTLKLQKEIEIAINRASAECASDTPDFILAEYLTDCLAAWNKASIARDKWYGRGPQPVENPLPAPDEANDKAQATPTRQAASTQNHE